MRRFCFTYRLSIGFDAPVSRHTFLFRFHPESDSTQQLWGLETDCAPAAALPLVRDACGNSCACGFIDQPHDRLTLNVRGDVVLRGGRLPAPARDCYAFASQMTRADAEIRALAEGLPADPVRAAMTASERIRTRVEYRQGVTGGHTTAIGALQIGGGVCQDMAHLLLAVLRCRRIPARYVAGLIPGEGETHAWVEVHDGEGYVGVDPTHLRRTDDRYLRVNVGRDSRDCAINRGLFSGCAGQTLQVFGKMTEIVRSALDD